jgi:hypothetical protein
MMPKGLTRFANNAGPMCSVLLGQIGSSAFENLIHLACASASDTFWAEGCTSPIHRARHEKGPGGSCLPGPRQPSSHRGVQQGRRRPPYHRRAAHVKRRLRGGLLSILPTMLFRAATPPKVFKSKARIGCISGVIYLRLSPSAALHFELHLLESAISGSCPTWHTIDHPGASWSPPSKSRPITSALVVT